MILAACSEGVLYLKDNATWSASKCETGHWSRATLLLRRIVFLQIHGHGPASSYRAWCFLIGQELHVRPVPAIPLDPSWHLDTSLFTDQEGDEFVPNRYESRRSVTSLPLAPRQVEVRRGYIVKSLVRPGVTEVATIIVNKCETIRQAIHNGDVRDCSRTTTRSVDTVIVFAGGEMQTQYLCYSV